MVTFVKLRQNLMKSNENQRLGDEGTSLFYLVFMFVRAFCVRNGIEKKISLLLRATSFKSNDGGGEKGGTHKKKKKKKRKKGKKGKKEKKEKKGRTAKKSRRLTSRQVLALEMARVGAQHKP